MTNPPTRPAHPGPAASADTVVPRTLTGALPALVTPLVDPSTIDAAGCTTLIHRALDDGASGVLVAGTTGEGSLLDPEQRVELTRLARAALTGHTTLAGTPPTLVVGASGPTLGALHADVARLAEAGADLVLVLPPPLQPLTPQELVTLHLDVAERAEVPTLLYHIPQLTGSPLTPEAVVQLARHERIVGIKDSSPDVERRAAIVAATRDQPGCSVLTGHAPTLAAALQAGADGSILAVSNLRLRQVVALHAAVAREDTDEVTRLQEALVRLTRGIGEVGASTPAVLKAALQLDGVLAERWCVPPLASVPPARLDHVRTALLR
ncbi:MAG: dihydrodipicolinate synthase family protein [Nitriliruptoraceae bacterium]